MDSTYKGVGGWEGVGGGLYLPIGLFGASMCPRSASHRPRQDWRAYNARCLTNTGVNIRPIATSHLVPSMGPHCLSCDFTWLAKPALEKQTSQLSPLMQQCMDSA